jgi:hypothetical protein
MLGYNTLYPTSNSSGKLHGNSVTGVSHLIILIQIDERRLMGRHLLRSQSDIRTNNNSIAWFRFVGRRAIN